MRVFVRRQGKVDHASLRPSSMGIVPQRSRLSARVVKVLPEAEGFRSEFYGILWLLPHLLTSIPPADDLDGLLSELPEDFFSDPSWGCLKTGHPP